MINLNYPCYIKYYVSCLEIKRGESNKSLPFKSDFTMYFKQSVTTQELQRYESEDVARLLLESFISPTFPQRLMDLCLRLWDLEKSDIM